MTEYDSSMSAQFNSELSKLNRVIQLFKYPLMIFTAIFIVSASFDKIHLAPTISGTGTLFWPVFTAFILVHIAAGFRVASIASYIEVIRATNLSPSYDERKVLERIVGYERKSSEATLTYMNVILTIAICKMILHPILTYYFAESLSVIIGVSMVMATIRTIVFCSVDIRRAT